MKKLFLLSLITLFVSCSSDDSNTPVKSVVVTDTYYTDAGYNNDGFLFTFHATVINETNETQTGFVRFDVELGQGSTYVDSPVFAIAPNQSKEVLFTSTRAFNTMYPKIFSVVFVK